MKGHSIARKGVVGCMLPLLCVVVAMSLTVEPAKIYVTLRNQTSTDLTDVQVSYRGGVERVSVLPSNSWVRLRIEPTGESGVQVRFTDSEGLAHVHEANAYIEPMYAGSLELRIQGPDKVVDVNDIYIAPVFSCRRREVRTPVLEHGK